MNKDILDVMDVVIGMIDDNLGQIENKKFGKHQVNTVTGYYKARFEGAMDMLLDRHIVRFCEEGSEEEDVKKEKTM